MFAYPRKHIAQRERFQNFYEYASHFERFIGIFFFFNIGGCSESVLTWILARLDGSKNFFFLFCFFFF